MQVSWNKEVVKSLTKDQFIEMHQHMKDDVDLDAEYDKIVPPKEKPEAKSKPAEDK